MDKCTGKILRKSFPRIDGAGVGEGEAGSYGARNRHHVSGISSIVHGVGVHNTTFEDAAVCR